MARIYQALTQNPREHQCVKALEINRLIQRDVSAFRNHAFHKFLSALEPFDLSILGMHDNSGGSIHGLDSYNFFASQLDLCFFDHLKNTTRLGLGGDESGPLGLEFPNTMDGTHRARLALLLNFSLVMLVSYRRFLCKIAILTLVRVRRMRMASAGRACLQLWQMLSRRS